MLAIKSVPSVVVKEAVSRVLNGYGSNVAAAKALGISPQYLHDIVRERRAIPDALLALAGYERVTVYRKRSK